LGWRVGQVGREPRVTVCCPLRSRRHNRGDARRRAIDVVRRRERPADHRAHGKRGENIGGHGRPLQTERLPRADQIHREPAIGAERFERGRHRGINAGISDHAQPQRGHAERGSRVSPFARKHGRHLAAVLVAE
jgi:hypothetical protein